MPYYRIVSRHGGAAAREPDTFTSTHACGAFRRTYTPGVGNEEHGKALFMYLDLADANRTAEMCGISTIWEVEPLSPAYVLGGYETLIGNVYWGTVEAERVTDDIWDEWYAAVRDGTVHDFTQRQLRGSIGAGGAGCQVAVTDSFRYVRAIDADWYAPVRERQENPHGL